MEYRSRSSSLCSLLHSPVTSPFLGPNILLSTLFSTILSLRSSPIVSDQVSHPYKTTGKITLLCILIFIFRIANWNKKNLHRMIASIPWLHSPLNFFRNGILIRYVFPKCPKCSTISKVLSSNFILSYIVTSRHRRVLSRPIIYSQTYLLIRNY